MTSTFHLKTVELLVYSLFGTSSVAEILPHTTGDLTAAKPLIVGTSAAMTNVMALAERAAASQATVLLTGESGTGKDLIARYIHARSSRAARPFITINCTAHQDLLLESECFGHVKGSMAGAQRDAVGRFSLADSGTILIDEISCASMRMQQLLLRFLETGEVQPVGAPSPARPVDVRVIAASSANLTHLVHNGVFREDLLYRLRVAHIHLPPLRERPDDVAPLVKHATAKTGRAVCFSEPALALLAAYQWPGNVRELQSVVEQLVWMSGVSLIDVQHLPAPFRTTGLRVASMVERRRHLADDLYAGLVARTISFWGQLYHLFLSRDVTRHDLREVLRRGLRTTSGSYRALIPLFGMEARDYKRLLNFLAAHDCNVDPRPFRKRRTDAPIRGSFHRTTVSRTHRKPAPGTSDERSQAES
jgi:DNA-binding NtrC family response regulator